MTNALTDLRIIELGEGPAIGMAGMIMADFGAEVLRIDRTETGCVAYLPAATMWARGMVSHTLDLDQQGDLAELSALMAGADVLLTNWRGNALRNAGLSFETLHRHHPHLVHCQITGFGSRGPLAELPGYEHLVAAYAGRMRQFTGIVDRPGPVMSAVQVGVHAAAQSAVAGTLAALLRREQTGIGRRVETSLLQGMLPYEMGAMIGQQFPEQFATIVPAMSITDTPPPPSLYYHPAQAGDGRWMQFGNLLPHLFDNFLIATDLIDVLADPAFDAKQMLLRPEESQEAFRERMLRRVQEQASSEWMANFIADGGIVATTYQTTQQALQDPDVTANGHVIPMGEDGVQLGPLARLSATPAEPGRAAADIEELRTRWRSTPRPSTPGEPDGPLPLSGIRVIELATIIAAPIGASFLADMGADVIKVEQIGGDPFRSMLDGLGASRVNVGKRSISLNLKTEQGKQAVQRLISQADVLIHNYRPGVPEKLGFGYDQLREANPALVYLQANGYGPDGPGAQRPSTHPIPGAAMGGVVYQMGDRLPESLQDFTELRTWTSRLMRANELNPDPNTGLVVASAAMLGLAARQRTGEGQLVLVDMFGANAYANADDFLNYPGKPSRAMPDELMHGFGALYRLYECLDGQWVFLAIPTEKERAEFITALRESGVEPPTAAILNANDKTASAALADLLAQRTADAWQDMLSAKGIACVRADGHTPALFWPQDDQTQAMGFVAKAVHPRLGPYTRHGPLVQFDGSTRGLAGPPLAGQHNEELLAESGFSADEISDMNANGIIWAE